MAQRIKQANLWGRIGTGVGQGLAQQLPKEIEHQRHAAGLKELANNSEGLNPQQFLAKAAGTYGITPQEIQSFGELAKMQQTKNAYANRSGVAPQKQMQLPQNFRDVDFANIPQRNNQINPANVSQAYGQPQIVNENPLNAKNLPISPWNPEKRMQVVNDYMQQGFTPDQSKDLALDDEKRELETNRTNKERLDILENEQNKAKLKLTEKIEKKTQKKGESLFGDISGEMLSNIERGMERDLRLNPNATVEDVTNDWSDRALQMAKTKNQLEGLSKQIGLSNIFSRGSTLSKLNEYSDIFRRAGNSEEYQNLLQKDFGLSPHGAASIAFPVNDKIKKYTSILQSKEGLKKINADPRSIATQIESMIGPDDSILSILRYLTDKYHGLDQNEFLSQISEDKDLINLNERQRLEIAKGIRENNPPGWADFYILGR